MTQNIQGEINEAIREGINMKLLRLATGLDSFEFNKGMRDDTFTIEQKNKILTVIKKWRKGD